MKTKRFLFSPICCCCSLPALIVVWFAAVAASAAVLFQDDFNRGLPGWTAVQPPGTNYFEGPMRWQYDIVSGAYIEQSNIYTDAATNSPSATAVMLINDAMTGANFTFTARLTAGDDDGFGLIFGYRDPTNFYRITFTRQARGMPGYPWNGWNVDRKVNDVAENLFGDGTPTHVPSFVNTQFRPFDVTIAVGGNDLFSLTVVDDPDGGSPTKYELVEAQPLPTQADGKVGFVSWGMSGTPLRGFRIANPTLSPVALAGDPNVLTEWTPVVPPRADGFSGLDPATGNGGVPIWSLALGPNGDYGTLNENSDSHGGNDAAGNVDFAAPTLVAGDVNWTDIVLTARIIPADDDGHGVIVRYQDEFNFYRVALRSQVNAVIGVRRGLSVQKVVGGFWEEVFWDNASQFIPPSNVPYDIAVSMIGDRMQVGVVSDPLGVARTFSYGPFDFTGDKLANGKIGLFSWAMSRTEFDYVRVNGIEGVPLTVASAYGSPDPAVGIHEIQPGSSVTASVASPVDVIPGMRAVVTGWSGSGSVPASGTASSVTFLINDISTITWEWQTQSTIAATHSAGGQVSGPLGVWLPTGTDVTFTATPDANHVFVGWSGDVISCDPDLSLVVSRPLNIVASFEADSDNDGLPDSWEQANFGDLAATGEGNPDKDGFDNADEFERGTDPNHAETLVVSDGLGSRWENVQRDPVLPGQLVVRDFGNGFRGVWENSNDYRSAVDTNFIGADFIVPEVSFEGPRMIIRTNVWNPAWTDFSAEVTFSVGDNDGNCVYFRYQDENNWYRVTVCGENNYLDWRAPYGVTVQKRVNGVFTELLEDATIATDPSDSSMYKRVRVTVIARGTEFEIRVIGWNVRVDPPEWDAGTELIQYVYDSDLTSGRFGVGTWGQSGGATATPTNPVGAGALIEDVVITVGGAEVFREDWQSVPLAAELPEGWIDPSVGGAAAGTWQVTAHGTILQTGNYATVTTGTLLQPKADGEGCILLGPAPGTDNYYLEIGFHPFDDDGIGFVFDFKDTDNFSRVILVSQPSGNTRIPQGLSVSRKVGGVWSDIIAGDPGFVYVNGTPFEFWFANNNGACRLTARSLDAPTVSQTWSWTGPPPAADNRFGLTCWGEQDAHFLYARAYSLPSREPPGDLRVGNVSIVDGNLVLEILEAGDMPFTVERSNTLTPGSWSVAAENQTGTEWSTPLSTAPGAVFFRLRQDR